MNSELPAISAPLVVRINAGLWVIVGIWALVGIGFNVALAVQTNAPQTAPRGMSLPEASALLAIFFHLPTLVAAWLMRRLHIVADERGLEFRGLYRTRFVAWSDIEDYELRAAPQAATAKPTWICAQGKWRQISQFYEPLNALRARIQIEATHSRARQWQLNVERDDAQNWPKTYAYRDPSGGKMFGWVAVGLLLIVAIIFVIPSSSVNSGGDALDKWLPLAAIFLPLFLIHFALFRTTKRLNSPTIRAHQNALSLVQSQNPTRIAWAEISDYFIEDPRGAVTIPQYVVESANVRIAFRHEISDFAELKALICARAVNAISREWKHRESTDADTIGGELSLWSNGVTGVGRKIYHYRTRTTRALLMLGGAMLLVLPIRILGMVPLSDGQMPTLPDRMIGLVFVAPIVALTLGGALAFWRSSIQTDENGITHRNVWSERSLNWDEIESFTFNGYFYTLKGASATIRYGLVAASDSLQTEIETRAELKMRRTDRSESDED